jgi:SAM-dependent methyltransferase
MSRPRSADSGSVAFYSRPSLNVDVYDELYSSVDDVPFFLEQARNAGNRVLELGVGTGRVAIPLARAGLQVTGVDRSPAMLAIAMRKTAALPSEVQDRLSLKHGDITALRIRGEFDIAFAAGRVFMSILDPSSQRRALNGVRRRLRRGGILVLDVFDPLLDRLTPGFHPAEDRGEVRHPISGNAVRVTAIERDADPVTQVLRERWRFAELDDSGSVIREEFEDLSLRWTYRYEFAHLLELARFDVIAEYSDFSGLPPAYGREQIWVARRSGSEPR